MTQELLQAAHIAIGVLTGAATALIGFLLWNSSINNKDAFTKTFLRVFAIISAMKAVEIMGAMYRASRIAPDVVPVDAAIAGLSGRFVELVGYLIAIWILLRPDTKNALSEQHIKNGNE